ncbi:MAG: ATP-binding protein, partial [Planctomycetota bacterium]
KGNDETAVKALNAGASSYVPKSMLEDRLLDSVESLLSIARHARGEPHTLGCPLGSQFSIDNDAAKIPASISRIRQILRQANLYDEATEIRTCVALEEALTNAMFHGNLDLDSRLREGDRQTFRVLVEERRSVDPYRHRRIHVSVSVEADRGAIVIRDEGQGFDATNLPDPTDPANLERLSGRGLLLMRTFMDEVRYNDIGNEVTLIKRK